MDRRIADGVTILAWAFSMAAGLTTNLIGAPASRPTTGPAAVLEAFRDESNRVYVTWKVSLWEPDQTGFALTRRVAEADGRKGPWKAIGSTLHQPNFSDDWLAQNKLDHVIKQKPKLKPDRIDAQKIIGWFIESPKDLAMTGGIASADIQWGIAFGMGWIDEASNAGSVYEYSLARVYEGNKTGPAIADFVLPAGVAKLRAPKVEEFTTGRTPRYNGAIEAGNGVLKVRIGQRAARYGHPGVWTSDDVEAAVQEADCLHRPLGASGPTPEQLWQSRKPITQVQRDRFAAVVRRARESSLAKIMEGHGLAGETIKREPRASVARQAIRRALEQSGHLSVQRKRIGPPINAPLRGKST